MDREKDVWSTLTGERNSSADGDACAFQNPDGSISDGVLKNGTCVMPTKGKGWDFANNLLSTVNNIFSTQGVNNTPANYGTQNYANGTQPSNGMGALGWSVIILAVAGIGFGVYKLTKK